MKNQLFDVFNESLFKSNTTEFVDEDGKYEIRMFTGPIICTLGISTEVEGGFDERALIPLNRSQFGFKYTSEGDRLQCLAELWVDRKPTKKALKEIIALATCNLKCAKEVVKHFNEEDTNEG